MTTASYIDLSVAPTTFTITLTGTQDSSSNSGTTDFDLVLTDPCDAPSSVAITSGESLTDQDYILLTNPGTTYVHPAFEADPSYCPVEYSYAANTLSNGESAWSVVLAD